MAYKYGSDQEHLPNGRSFRLRRVTWKSTPSNQGCLLLVGFLLRRNTLTPTTLRGPAPNGHPCPDGALAASMRLGPLHVVCVRPAPRSRLAASGRFAQEDQDQKQIKSFPADAGPTGCTRSAFSGTGFSREEASSGADIFADSPPHCGSELARECFITNTRYLLDVPPPS